MSLNSKIVAFDLDNTLFDCENSDYYINVGTLSKMGITNIGRSHYKSLRSTFSIKEILNRFGVLDHEEFFEKRKSIESNKELFLLDEPIVNRDLLAEMKKDTNLVIITRRESESEVARQLNRWNLELFSHIFTTGLIEEPSLIQAKADCLVLSGACVYVGDKMSDMQAAEMALTFPVFVETGFQRIKHEYLTYGNVNDFIRNFLKGDFN